MGTMTGGTSHRRIGFRAGVAGEVGAGMTIKASCGQIFMIRLDIGGGDRGVGDTVVIGGAMAFLAVERGFGAIAVGGVIKRIDVDTGGD